MRRDTYFLKRGAALLLSLFMLSTALCAAAESDAEKGESFMFENEIPEEYRTKVPDGGRIEEITYLSKDYYRDRADVEKHALVYVPAGYTGDEPCDVLVLCHGVGGTEYEWGFTNADSESKNLTDHLFAEGEVRNLIIVLPNGRSTAKYDDVSFGNMYSFYPFGQELRNDLLPYIDAHYNTYGDREHRAMAGLSMGGMQTINIGMCECLDLFSAFGAFSAAPTSLTSGELANKLKDFPEDLSIRYFYNLCGTEDGIAYASASAAAKKMPADSRLSEENWCWQERSGEHNFDIWYLGLYNFLKLLGSMQE